MKVSLSWLKDYLEFNNSPEEVAAILTDTGLEVEKVETVESIKGGLKGIVVGHVTKKWQHPNADRLNLTLVDIGSSDPLQIVCGASNVAEGQKVLVATIGAMIYPKDGEPFKIKKGKLRGELSQGMICAEDELGLGNSHDGIMVLDASAKTGVAAAEYLNLTSETVLDIGLTPNRTDAMGHFGVARDLAVALKHNHNQNTTLKKPKADLPVLAEDCPVQITVTDKKLCSRYVGLVINNLKIDDSPKWLADRLKSIGLEPINNVVDITNYVLHEYGHPLHAFDLDKINGNEIKVKCLEKGTKFTTLDDKERELSDSDIMICDGHGEPLCLAGVFGGADSGLSQKTTSIFLECAVFNPVMVRKSAKRHQLSTDASFRFERGVDQDACLEVITRAASLIQELAGGEITSRFNDVLTDPLEEITVDFSPQRCNALIGTQIPHDKIRAILTDLDFTVSGDRDVWKCKVPKYRVDVTREADVIEEVLRIYGYNNVPMPEKMNASLSYFGQYNEEATRTEVADSLVGLGFSEMMTNSLTKTGHEEVSPPDVYGSPVKMLNPLSSDLSDLRTSLAYNMLSSVVFNVNRKSPDLKLFELGKVYARSEKGFNEKLMLGLLVTGKTEISSWKNQSADSDMFYLVNAVENIFKKLNIDYKLKPSGNGLKLVSKKNQLASFRKATSEEVKHFGLKQDVFMAFIDWDTSSSLAKTGITYSALNKFPVVTRDLSLLLDAEINFSELKNAASQSASHLLKDVVLFDVYKGDKLPKGKKSYAIRYNLEDKSKTLDDKVIDKTMDKIINAYKKQFNAELR